VAVEHSTIVLPQAGGVEEIVEPRPGRGAFHFLNNPTILGFSPVSAAGMLRDNGVLLGFLTLVLKN
jgi:hypothetical protein